MDSARRWPPRGSSVAEPGVAWLFVGLVAGAFLPGIIRWALNRPRERAVTVDPGRVNLPRDRSQEALIAAFRPDELKDPEDAIRDDQRILADALRDVARRRDAQAAILWVLDEEIGGLAMPVATSADDARSSHTPASLPIVGEGDRGVVEWVARE